MFENLLVESDLEIEFDARHKLKLVSVANEPINVMELKIPNVVVGVALLRQMLHLGDPDRQFSRANQLLSALKIRVDVMFLNHKVVSVGHNASKNAFQKLMSAFPLES